MSDDETFYRVIHVKDDSQIRLTINNFRGVDYISLREYYMDFDEEWQPTAKGVTMPLSIPITRELFIGLVEILSLAESKDILQEHFKDVLDNIYV
jgi:hypothetical protein